jgi:hypothetical protein
MLCGDPNTSDTFSRGEILSMMFIANMYVASYQFPLEQTLALHPSGCIADSNGPLRSLLRHMHRPWNLRQAFHTDVLHSIHHLTVPSQQQPKIS